MSRAPRSVVLVTVDCLRADHVGHLGYARPTTPFLDCLAKESWVFRNAIAAGAPTYYSLPALLASRYPLALGRDLIGLAPGESTVASVLQEYGFATAAFTAGNPYISAQFGYDQSFDVFGDFLRGYGLDPWEDIQQGSGFHSRANYLISKMCHSVPVLGSAYDEFYFRYCQLQSNGKDGSLDSLRRFPSADVIVDRAITWLSENSGKSFFLWLHFMDPHAPYFPKPEALQVMGDGQITARDARYLNSYWARSGIGQQRLYRKRDDIIKLYDAGVRWADEQIRRLTEKLIDLNVWDKCLLAVTADHGEEFLDHGGRFHPPVKLTDELIHVPLLLRVPGSPHVEVEEPMSLIDLAPTLLDIAQIPSPADFRGKSCSPEKGSPGRKRPVIAEAVYGCSNPFHSRNREGPRILAVQNGNYKLVIDFSSGADQLFDLQCDPGERQRLPPQTAKSARKQLLECARRHVVESHKSRDFDKRTATMLRDLRLEWAHPAITAN
jgi:arylsulfatase A-like enzyme